MALKAKELKAIAWYIKEHNLKPQLSTPPTMYFKNKDGKPVKQDLATILSEWSHWNEEDKKERARQRRSDKIGQEIKW